MANIFADLPPKNIDKSCGLCYILENTGSTNGAAKTERSLGYETLPPIEK